MKHKAIKVFFHGERLRDIYPHASKWQVFKWKVRKFIRKVTIVSIACAALYGAFVVGSKSFHETAYQAQAEKITTVEVQVDNLSEKIAQIKAEAVEGIRKCESAGHPESDGIIIFDSNAKASIGSFQFQKTTVQHYMKVLYGKDITPKEAVLIALDEAKAGELASDIIFETPGGGLKDWYTCANKIGLANTIAIVKKLEK